MNQRDEQEGGEQTRIIPPDPQPDMPKPGKPEPDMPPTVLPGPEVENPPEPKPETDRPLTQPQPDIKGEDA